MDYFGAPIEEVKNDIRVVFERCGVITVRFAHLMEKPHFKVGQTISNGQVIGIMGDTGASNLAHLHIDNALGCIRKPWKLRDVELGLIHPDPRELNWHIDEGMMDKIKVTTHYCDYDYMRERGKLHFGYDCSSTAKWPVKIRWNRSYKGTVVYNDYDEAYGNCIMIAYERRK